MDGSAACVGRGVGDRECRNRSAIPGLPRWLLLLLLAETLLLGVVLVLVFRGRRQAPTVAGKPEAERTEVRGAEGETLGALVRLAGETSDRATALQEKLIRYGNPLEEDLLHWKSLVLETARQSTEALVTLWGVRKEPMAQVLFNQISMSLGRMGIQVVVPEIGEEIDSRDKRYLVESGGSAARVRVREVLNPGFVLTIPRRLPDQPLEQHVLAVAKVRTEQTAGA